MSANWKTTVRRWLSRRNLKWFALGLALLGAIDLTRFYFQCRHYSHRATDLAAERSQLPGDASGEAIVVVTGDNNRIAEALALLRVRNSPLLVISGAGYGITLTDLVNEQGSASVRIHETWERIRVESRSSSTVENAVETVRILNEEDLNLKRLVLVTSDYHMPRTLTIYRSATAGYEIVPYPVPSVFTKSNDFSEWRSGVQRFVMEYLKRVLYHLYILPRP